MLKEGDSVEVIIGISGRLKEWKVQERQVIGDVMLEVISSSYDLCSNGS